MTSPLSETELNEVMEAAKMAESTSEARIIHKSISNDTDAVYPCAYRPMLIEKGPWNFTEKRFDQLKLNADFCAAANPLTIIRMVEEIRELKSEVKMWKNRKQL